MLRFIPLFTFIWLSFDVIAQDDYTSIRTALVIGNATYPETPLRNPANDATDMGEQLEKMVEEFRTTKDYTDDV